MNYLGYENKEKRLETFHSDQFIWHVSKGIEKRNIGEEEEEEEGKRQVKKKHFVY